jgi:hypothetical protein
MPSKCTKQQGAILIIMLVIMVIGFAVILVNSLTASRVKNLRQANTTAALAQAKAALIGYAITYGDTHSNEVHGYLPCPDSDASNGEGSSNLTCGSQDVSAIGRLPWRTLGLSALRDGDGECLWYAVSGTYKSNPKTGLMNWDTNGQFQVNSSDNTLLANNVVAVIIAPEATQSGQDRSGTSAPVCGGNYIASNYLDSDGTINNATASSTALATSTFRLGTASGINDQMVFITSDDIWNAIQKRADFQNTLNQLPRKVAQCLALYGNSNDSCGGSCSNLSLPWAAPVTLGTNLLSDYYDNANYNDTFGLYAGRVPYKTGTSAGSHNSLTTLMNTTSCGAGWASYDPWWNNWKDHLFYGLAPAFEPSSGGGQACGTCPNINGAGQYAAIVIFAGKKLTGQDRTLKNNGAGYLELKNVNRLNSPTSGGGQYTAGTISGFNDVVCYISQSLNVSCI